MHIFHISTSTKFKFISIFPGITFWGQEQLDTVSGTIVLLYFVQFNYTIHPYM